MCGLTRVDEAITCSNLGVKAIGCVFYPKSPRHVNEEQAQTICQAVPDDIKTVGVFVNETLGNIMRKVKICNLKAVQLHGSETPELVESLRLENIFVIKALFVDGSPSLKDVCNYNASAYLVECGKGILPGGNALTWNWGKAQAFGEKHPLILAGGLSVENIAGAVAASLPDAVDISSAVESMPGRKDSVKVKAFMSAVSKCMIKHKLRKIF